MIKLNNKNITYVALADSNNSLKAPKEIWYADSANSVKLVYRRKDALIEGEDYEKYHWILTDTGNPYIQVDDICNTDENAYIETTYKSKYTNPGSDMLIGFSINETNNIGIRIFNLAYNGRTTCVDYHKTVNGVLSSFRTTKKQDNINAERYIKATFNNLIIDNTEYPTINWGSGFDNLINPVTILHTNQHLDNDVRYKRTKLRVNFKEHDLIPCKLLKPVPKWLDANGIRRQVGECGMIDLVSGKFYGNVNSVGTFTVENYYERKEWLVGDGSAYISGITYNLWDNHLVSQVYNINKKYAQFVQSDINNSDRNISMTRNSIYLQIIFRELSQTNTTHIADLNPNDFSGAIDLDYYISDSNFNVKVNGVTYTNATSVYATESKWKSFNGLSIYSEMMSYIREITPSGIYVSNLIPCTLTMDLPASMDANNIARTKGTSGMWDLVSDRFYGNVANSGTFKAVNLAEGVDYEVHQWLKGDGTAYIDTNIIVNSSTLVLSIKSKTSSSTANGALCGSRNGANTNSDTTAIHYQSGRYRLDLLTVGTNYVWVNKDNLEDTFDIDLASNTAVANGTSFTSSKNHTNSINTFRVFGCSSASVGYSGYINKFMLNDGYNNLNLIPVKLLRSIPAKYDANGIARNAGECGMYDTVNDVFYGNVASSGTFSVSDDS